MQNSLCARQGITFVSGESHYELQERESLVEKKVQALNDKENVRDIIMTAQTEAIKSMATVVNHTQYKLSSFLNVYPHLAFSANYMAMKMIKLSQNLNRVAYAARRRKMDLFALSILLNSTDFDEIDESSTILRKVKVPTSNRIQIEFIGHTVDPSTHVYRVDPFRFWANLTETPVLMEYTGEKFLIFNQTNNCVKAIDEPTHSYVSDKCEIVDGVDYRLSNWQQVMSTDDPYSQPAFTSVKNSWPYTYIYCYRLNVTIRGETARCPPYVFRVNATLGWNSTDYKKPPVEQAEIEKALDLTPMTHEIHSVHFVDDKHMIDENMAIDKVKQLTKQLENMREENMALSLPFQTGITNRAMIKLMTVGTVFLLACILALLFYKHSRDTRRHHRVMQTMTDGIYGDGTYEAVRANRRRCASATTNTMPSQVNVTLNSPQTTAAPQPPPRPDVGQT